MRKIYIPKLAQNEASFVKGKKIPAVIMDAYIVSAFKNPTDTIRNSCKTFIIDPNTNYFIGDFLTVKKSFNKLPTTPKKPYKIEDLLTNESIRKYKFVKKSIGYQIREKASLIILPYLYSDSIEDTKFSLNLTMISDGIKLIQDNKIKLPVYAMINLGNQILGDYQKLDKLIDRYSEDFGNKIDGCFIMINQFDCRKASEKELLGLAYLTFHLSKKRNIYLLKIGDYGELLSCIGASGYSSSIGGGETFNAAGLFKKLKAFGRDHSKITYVPELFNYLNDEELKKIGYKCHCSVCDQTNGIPVGRNNKKFHFLERKLQGIEGLNKVQDETKIDFIKLKIEEAIELAKKYNSQYPISIKTDFLIRWKNVLIKSKHWENRDGAKEEVDLDSLIEEAKGKNVK
jgi:hypothetical protein